MHRCRATQSHARIERVEPRLLMAVFTVTNTDEAGPGSLRQAILDANGAPGADEVRFNIPGDAQAVRTIAPLSPLPDVFDTLDLNGISQGHPTGRPIELDGEFAGPGAVGLRLTGRGSRVRGFRINRFASHGLVLEGGGEHLIIDNYIGTPPFGSSVAGNGGSGILVSGSANNQLGSLMPGGGNNYSSGNGRYGIEIRGAASTGNILNANYIGVGVNIAGGDIPLPNALGGVLIDGAPGNRVGSLERAVAGSSNVISGNNGPGVRVTGPVSVGNTVGGNHIGLNWVGSTAVSNSGQGIVVEEGARQTQIIANDIAGNLGGGVLITGPETGGSVLEGNHIGTTHDATEAGAGMPIGNGPLGVGVHLRSPDNRVGGDAPDPSVRNIIAYNEGGGIVVQGVPSQGGPPEGNTFAGNAIHSNGGLGVDLRRDGVTANDPGDADRGPNGLQNFPVVTSAALAETPNPWPAPTTVGTRVRGTFNSTPNTTFKFRFYANPEPDSSGFGEGRTYLGMADVTTDAAGNAAFDVTIHAGDLADVQPAPARPGEYVTATATAPDGSTSEFSNAALVPGVVGRHVFYNGSAFDGSDSAANAADDNAIAPGIQGALPLGFAGTGSYTTYYKGINGIMVDLLGRPAGAPAPLPEDIDVRLVTPLIPPLPPVLAPGPAPTQVALRPRAGAGGSDRLSLVFPDRSIRNTCVQITVKPSERTGLTTPDVFYFGNLAGDTATDSIRSASVNALDLAMVKRDMTTYVGQSVPITLISDHNKDRRVNALDLAVVRANLGDTLTFFSPPLPTPPPPVGAALLTSADDDGALLFA